MKYPKSRQLEIQSWTVKCKFIINMKIKKNKWTELNNSLTPRGFYYSKMARM